MWKSKVDFLLLFLLILIDFSNASSTKTHFQLRSERRTIGDSRDEKKSYTQIGVYFTSNRLTVFQTSFDNIDNFLSFTNHSNLLKSVS